MEHPDPSPRFSTSVLDALSATVAVLNQRGVIVFVNRSWREFARQNAGQDELGVNYLHVCEDTDQTSEHDGPRMARGIRDVLRGAPLFELEYPCHSPDEERYFVARVTAFEHEGQRYALVAHENVTRRRRAELEVLALNAALEEKVVRRTRDLNAAQEALESRNVQLQRRNEELAQFAHAASHDLQEPLRILSAYADVLHHRYHSQLDNRAQGYLREIVAQVARARALVRDVLTLSFVDDPAATVTVNLSEEWHALQEHLPWPPGTTVSTGVTPPVRAHAGQVRLLLSNLLGNALKFRAPDRALTVTLTARQDGPWVQFTVTDNGVGIPAEQAGQVFGLFRRLHGRSTAEGNGIGLTICRRVVEGHGGQIWVDAHATQGATLHFTLPAA